MSRGRQRGRVLRAPRLRVCGALVLGALASPGCREDEDDYGACDPEVVDWANTLTPDPDTWGGAGRGALGCAGGITSHDECMGCLSECFAERIRAPALEYAETWASSTYGGGAIWISEVRAECGPIWLNGRCCYLVEVATGTLN